MRGHVAKNNATMGLDVLGTCASDVEIPDAGLVASPVGPTVLKTIRSCLAELCILNCASA